MDKRKKDKEDVVMAATAMEYNEKIFLSEFEGSLKEVQEKKKSSNSKSAQSSWRELFTMDEEQVFHIVQN